MKKEIKKVPLKLMSKVILKSAKKEANSACFFIGYQPEVPDKIKKLRKF